MTAVIVFAIVGLTEVGPNICKVDYMRYVDMQSVTLPCDMIKKEIYDAKIN
jgi:hypothetical protein